MESSELAALLVALFLTALAAALFLLFLWSRNKYGRVITVTNAPPPPWWQRWTVLFFKSVLIELVSLVFTIFAIVGLETQDWRHLDIGPARVGFYVFNVTLKYAILLSTVLIEQLAPEWPRQVAVRLRIRADWPQLVELAVFTPCLLIDGVVLNAEYALGSLGDVVDYDGVALITLDTLLYAKASLTALAALHSENGRCQYDLLQIGYGLISFAHVTSVAFLFIVVHLEALPASGMAMTGRMAIVLVCLLTMSYVGSYTAMLRQGVVALDRALKYTQFRVRQLQAFIVYFSPHPLWLALNVLVYAFAAFVYIALLVIAAELSLRGRREGFARGLIVYNAVLTISLTSFLLANWIYAVLKRIGAFCSWRYPFNCSTYSAALSQAGVLINLDARQKSAVGRR